MSQTSGSSLIWLVVAMVLILVTLFNSGCAPQSVNSVWAREKIVANGTEDEWRSPPQHYDRDRSVTIRVNNENEAIYLCFSTTDDALARQLIKSGLTLWIDPLGGQEKAFGIHLPSLDRGKHRKKARNLSSPSVEATDVGKRHRPSTIEMPDTLSITYAEATGPLEMSLAEIQHTGIHIGIGQRNGRGLVCEFAIRYDAAPCLRGLTQGTIAGIGFESATLRQGRSKDESSFDMRGRGSKGGRSRGGFGQPGASRSSRKQMGKPYDLWLVVKLAHSAAAG
jgi:hypothetical protein